MTDAEFADASRGGRNQRQVLPEGFQTSLWDGVTPVWRALDLRYDQVCCAGGSLRGARRPRGRRSDASPTRRLHPALLAAPQCVGMCDCLPDRDLREGYMTVHFSCIQGRLLKPGAYATEYA